jgi:regulator of protease activity HflC (stomatin/prohibitin superfamily)
LIEVFGKYSHTFKPGLNFLFPGIEKVRAAISVWEQTIPLFTSPIKIDFTDGSATPKGAEVFVKIKNPDLPYLACDGKTETGVYRAIYEIGNWREAVRALVENAIRSHLNGMTIDEGITLKGAGFDLKSKLPPEEVVRIEGDLDGWGLELLRVTITDFDLDPEIIKARGDVQVHLREAQASEFKRQEIARGTMGAFVQMIAEATGKKFEKVQEEISSDPEMKERLLKFSEDLIIRRMSIDGKSLNDVRVSGGGDLEQILLRLFTALKGKPEEKEKKYEEKNFGKDKNRERSREDGQ